jgi:hypothetical protein
MDVMRWDAERRGPPAERRQKAHLAQLFRQQAVVDPTVVPAAPGAKLVQPENERNTEKLAPDPHEFIPMQRVVCCGPSQGIGS